MPTLYGNPNTVTVSGQSSGGHLAHRLQVIYSDKIKGSSLFQCGPYGTEYDQYADGTTESLKNTAISVIDGYAGSGLIEPIGTYKDIVSYIIAGTQDTFVPPAAVSAIDELMAHYGVTKKYKNDMDIGHGMNRDMVDTALPWMF